MKSIVSEIVTKFNLKNLNPLKMLPLNITVYINLKNYLLKAQNTPKHIRINV